MDALRAPAQTFGLFQERTGAYVALPSQSGDRGPRGHKLWRLYVPRLFWTAPVLVPD